MSPGFFWVIRLISTILLSRWSRYFLSFSILAVSLPSFLYCSKCTNCNWYHRHPSCSTVFLALWLRSSYFSILYFFILFSFCWSPERQNPIDDKFSLDFFKINSSLQTFMLWEPYPSHHNGLFSPLLVLRDFAASRTIPELPSLSTFIYVPDEDKTIKAYYRR